MDAEAHPGAREGSGSQPELRGEPGFAS